MSGSGFSASRKRCSLSHARYVETKTQINATIQTTATSEAFGCKGRCHEWDEEKDQEDWPRHSSQPIASYAVEVGRERHL